MADTRNYSARTVFEGLKSTFHQYLEAQYHIWDEDLIEERRRLLNSQGITFQEPRLEATPFYTSGKKYRDLSIPQPAKDILTLSSSRDVGIYREPYSHQASALVEFLGRGEEIIVATGTGSGKTECFLMPILGSLAVESVERSDSWLKPGCRAILLYPMNALVNDQLSRLRRLIGDDEIARALKGNRKGRATFGMYTSRTPYPGKDTPEKNRKRIGELLNKQFRDSNGEPLTAKLRALLEKEGKWPTKDIERFIGASFETGPEDSELFSRQEMQKAAPDILITNYSMLEYMLLRPIERTIFEQTAQWLACSQENYLTVVLDEAHMYRGSGGAEVAYLLRRLHSRLRVGRDRIRYILTSASLGSTEEANQQMKLFAANLTGMETHREFVLISGTQEKKSGERTATIQEAIALSVFDFTSLHKIHEVGVRPAEEAFRNLLGKLGKNIPNKPLDDKDLQYLIHDWLQSFGPAALVANLITSSPQSLSTIAEKIFPEGGSAAGDALESLLAMMTFAREKEKDRVFSPVRSHLFFRGLPGLFACVNPLCSGRAIKNKPSILGRLFSTPRLRCDCGARVYELLIHRDCGAAYIRAFLRHEEDMFLWHEPSTGLWSENALLEAHFLVEVVRQSDRSNERRKVWLHMETGRLSPTKPGPELASQYRELVRPNGTVPGNSGQIHSFNGECPVCLKGWQNVPKIMNQTTKGEAPFAHLVREQVTLQPATEKPSVQSPNAGRKALLFSDGRQKAARLARDIPREIEKDVFRQVLLLAATKLNQNDFEAMLSQRIYVAFLDVLAGTGLQFFDGEDRLKLQRHVADYQEYYNSDFKSALDSDDGFDSSPPPRFTALLMRQIGSPYYSVNALTLAYLCPTKKAMREIERSYSSIDKEVALNLSIPWLQGFANKFAFDPDISSGIRRKASGAEGFPISIGILAKEGFSKRQRDFLNEKIVDLDSFIETLAKLLSAEDRGGFFLKPNRVRLELAIEKKWYQCLSCTAISPVTWWGHCPNCLSPRVLQVEPASTNYLRARKDFWREPVVRALKNEEPLLNLAVEEHTAQLSFLDRDDPMPTTEEFERRFRDILIAPSDTSIDVLSSTTTMEVGIDIGSLVAVGLRNIPPQRQNYQQRAGRAGRRGAAISTVLTYAQNSPHDNHYFKNPALIISGDPPLPTVDTKNPQIIERHIRAQLIQAFFHSKVVANSDSNLFSMLGNTWDYYVGTGDFSLQAFKKWIQEGREVQICYNSIQEWLPSCFERTPAEVAKEFVSNLEENQPKSEGELDQTENSLIEFLFSRGFLPSYAFPRNLCSLQIESRKKDFPHFGTIERPQQGLNIALSEYAPGRLVVVNKKTYRIRTVAASSSKTEIDRAERLFSGMRKYVHCAECLCFIDEYSEGKTCPLCQSANLETVTVIQPEVVYPEDRGEIDEYDDEQIYTQATSAQLPFLEGETRFENTFLSQGQLTALRTQTLVMVNKGENDDGFLICSKCGRTSFDRIEEAHERDYYILTPHGVPAPPKKCNGKFEQVYLGYTFTSDILLFRIPIVQPFRFHPTQKRDRQPLADALQSLSEAIVLGVGLVLDIDSREINAGYRFVRHGTEHFADIFVYDTLSGGAGYATQAEHVFQEIFNKAEELLVKCDCSSSCDKCLRHYGNRFHHGSLDRYLALDLIRFVKEGQAPMVFDRSRQQEMLKPLVQMLILEGWEVSDERKAPITASRSGHSVSFWSYPSLVEPKEQGFIGAHGEFAFSPYDLSRDLPGAFSLVS